jgi:ribulose kinase
VVTVAAYGTRHIVETMRANGCGVRVLFACGGLSKSSLFVREHCDATGCPVVLPKQPDAVIMGAAVAAAAAAGRYESVAKAMNAMNHADAVVQPVAHDRSDGALHTLLLCCCLLC